MSKTSTIPEAVLRTIKTNYLLESLMDQGLKPDEVYDALNALWERPNLGGVRLRNKAILGNMNTPTIAMGIYADETDGDADFARGLTNRLEDARVRDAAAQGYLGELSRVAGYEIKDVHGYIGHKDGYIQLRGRYFIAEGKLVLPGSQIRQLDNQTELSLIDLRVAIRRSR